MEQNIILVGCGGIGGWAAQCLAKTLTDSRTILVDGDIIEEKNLDRQLFTKDSVGKNKAEALGDVFINSGRKGSVSHIPHYLGSSEFNALTQKHPLPDYATILVGVDNHPARKYALELADELIGECIIAANEYEDAEAYYYKSAWKGTDLDPRTYYPEILTDSTDNPLAPPCTGEILESAPQLAVANMNAGSLMMWLYWYWNNNAPKLTDPMVLDRRIVGIRSTAFSWQFITEQDRKLKEVS